MSESVPRTLPPSPQVEIPLYNTSGWLVLAAVFGIVSSVVIVYKFKFFNGAKRTNTTESNIQLKNLSGVEQS